MKKIVTLLFLACFGIGFAQNSDAAQPIKEQTIPGITNPTWLSDAGISRGNGHDRQDLGIILKKNTTFKIRQTNPNFKQTVRLRLLGNDKSIEQSVQVGTNWVGVITSHDVVPFIDTPFGEVPATIQYQIENDQKPKELPIYKENGNAQTFFKTWDQQDAEYALIKSNKFQMFAPKKDKAALRNLKDFSSLNDLIHYFDGIFDYNDKLIGLDNSSPVHRRPDTRYFIKADINGAGYAYYSGIWTALSKDEIGEMWLEKNTWGTLHEIAHGYQARFDNNGMFTGEVTNNLFGAQYQYDKLGKEKADKTGWLFDYGRKTEVDRKLYNELITSGKGYNEISDLRLKLVMLTLLKQKAGNDAFTQLYRNYREMAAADKIAAASHSYPELMQKYYSETNKIDVTPILEKWKLGTVDLQGELNRSRGYEPVAPLAYIVPENQLPAARKATDHTMQINSNFQMVTNKEIASLGLKGNLTVTLKTDDLAGLMNQKIYLKDGNKTVKEATITGSNVTFTNVPNGVYRIVAPSFVKGQNYLQNQHYVFVKEQNNAFHLTVNKAYSSTLTNEKIDFAGLGESVFATAKVQANKQELTFEVVSDTPHSYFPNETYASLQVKDQKGTVLQNIALKGANEKIRTTTLPFKEGYTLSIYHREGESRLLASNGLINKKTKTNQFVLTKQGLKNTTFQHNPETNLIKKIDDLGQLILKNQELEPFQQSEVKYQLWAAIQLLSEPNKSNYMEKYKQIFDVPESKENEYAFIFKGYADRVFATLNVHTETLKASLETNKGVPHSYFNDAYSTIMIQNKEGQLTFKKEYIGKENYPQQTETPAIAMGDYLTVTHKEPKNRLAIVAQPNNKPLETAEKITYQVTDKGLVKTTAPPIKEPEEDVKQAVFTFKGLGDNLFATMNLDLEKKNATIETKKTMPHWYFDELYASILIQNNDGVKQFYKEYMGRKDYPQATETNPIQLNDYITITHKEADIRLAITTQPNNKPLEVANTITYQVTNKGLVKAVAPPLKEPVIAKPVKMTFNGLGDETFAGMTIDFQKKQAVIDVKAAMPHWYFTELYASILVKSNTGQTKYQQDFLGRTNYPASQKAVSLAWNDTITVTHKEWQNRLLIDSEDQTIEKGLTTTYKVTQEGLQVVK